MTVVEAPPADAEEPQEPGKPQVPDVSAAEMAEAIGNTEDLKRKSRVAAFNPLPGVPEATLGKVALVNGWGPWVRYHVLFDNGVSLGSINRGDLAPAKEYQALVRKRAEALASGVFDQVDEPEVEEGGEEAAGGGGDAPVVNGVTVPPYLIERSKAARERLGAA